VEAESYAPFVLLTHIGILMGYRLCPKYPVAEIKLKMKLFQNWSQTDSKDEVYHLLGYDAVWSVELYPTFLRNVGYNSTDYTASYPRR
jgi:hypothetical protein